MTNSEDRIDYDILIAKYLDNEITNNEKAQLTAWIKSSKAHEQYFIETAKAWEKSTIMFADKDALQKRLTTFLHKQNKTKKRRLYQWSIASAAATLLILVGLQLFHGNSMFGEKTQTIVAESDKMSIMLPDSSIVWLNKNSRITYPSKFKKSREVTLTGEAYFDVHKNKNKSFFVHTKNITIEVLGTRFLITARENDNITETILESGKVNLTVNSTGEKIQMNPNQSIIYNKQDGSTSLKAVDASDYTSWRKDNLTFENVYLKNVFTQLEKWYDIEITCTDKSLLFTPVSFTVDSEPVEDILFILQQITSLKWKQENNEIIIY